MSSEINARVREAATLVLVRESHDSGFEVFMVERPGAAAFGGLHVFPGGKVDPADAMDPSLCRGLTDDQASAELGISAGGLAYWVAAIRESFEEVGVLLGGCAGAPVDLSDPLIEQRFAAYRDALQRGELAMTDLCHRERIVLAADEVQYFAHWITPLGAPARFDTRFFLAVMPERQSVAHHELELSSGAWIAPREALLRHREGTWRMIHPTITTLEILSGFSTVDTLRAAVANRRHLPPVTEERLRQGMQPLETPGGAFGTGK